MLYYTRVRVRQTERSVSDILLLYYIFTVYKILCFRETILLHFLLAQTAVIGRVSGGGLYSHAAPCSRPVHSRLKCTILLLSYCHCNTLHAIYITSHNILLYSRQHNCIISCNRLPRFCAGDV